MMRRDISFSAKIAALRALESESSAWPDRASVRVVRNYTLENLGPLLRWDCAGARIAVDVSFSEFDAWEQDVFQIVADNTEREYDLIFVSLWADGLLGDTKSSELDPEAFVERFRGSMDRLLASTSAHLAITTLLPTFSALSDVRVRRGSPVDRGAVEEVNRALCAWASHSSRVEVVDLAAVVRRLGESAALDRRFWYRAGAPLRNAALSQVSAQLSQIVSALKGRVKKVLALDCDNTLWGGVVGEDGVDGIALSPNTYPGSAFYDFHRQLLALKERGVLLTLCSKNNEPDAMAVFDRHPHSLLRPHDFVAWRINWQDKASNLSELSEALNVGIESFVFLDDSPVECGLVRESLPEVTVLQVPEDPAAIPLVLRDYVGFDQLFVSDEDRARTQMYRQQVQREQVRTAHVDLDGYLRSLELRAEIRRPSLPEVVRVAQLTQKTNQFNLTTRRYGEADIQRFLESPDHELLCLRAWDRYGDYGLTGVAIVGLSDGQPVIDTFLMSCRILGRRLEFAFLRTLLRVTALRFPACQEIHGIYIPTKKNTQVLDFYPRAGFWELRKETPGRYVASLDETFVERLGRSPEDITSITVTEELPRGAT